jgi:hypothetical protein
MTMGVRVMIMGPLAVPARCHYAASDNISIPLWAVSCKDFIPQTEHISTPANPNLLWKQCGFFSVELSPSDPR